jgi:hypothetical protein
MDADRSGGRRNEPIVGETPGRSLDSQMSAGLAGARQTMVSSTVKDLVTGSGFALADEGEQSLEGVEQPWRVYSLTPSGGER